LNAVYCLSKIQFNEISLQKVVDVAEDIRARSLEDQEFAIYFKEKVLKSIHTKAFPKDEVKLLVDELSTKLYGSD
jgi:hypothetical protein